MKARNFKEDKEYAFNSYCKRILKQNAIDLQRKAARLDEREVTFSSLSERELTELAVMDTYFTDEYVFSVLGKSVGVTDYDLAEALTAIPADRREIVLLSYFFDMTDKEISMRLNMARRTVAHRRTSTLNELKKILESED